MAVVEIRFVGKDETGAAAKSVASAVREIGPAAHQAGSGMQGLLGMFANLTIAAWRGYQRHGRGAVFLAVAEGQVYYRTAAELRLHADGWEGTHAMGVKVTGHELDHAAGLRRLVAAAADYDPHASFVLSVLLTDVDRWIAEVLTPPHPPARCRRRWQPVPH
jgi:hypothetical protein